MKRYERFVLEAEKGINFEVSDGTSGELIIKDMSENYVNPPILKGYRHVCGEWNNGFVIERNSDGSQFVWVPVGSLNSNGTLDGASFVEKFGRRNYMDDEFSEREFHEPFTKELELQFKSVKKNGGFYISRYNISKNKKTGEPQSVKGAIPLININFNDAKKLASKLETRDTITSHLVFGAEYDSVLEWFLESKVRNYNEVVKDSTEWGNHWNTNNSPRALVETGSQERWCTNNIYDFAGNASEWTQEKKENLYCVVRGSDYGDDGNVYSVAYRDADNPEDNYISAAFRATLCI